MIVRASGSGWCSGWCSQRTARHGGLGGLKGGKARAEKLTKEQRSEIARKAAKARWDKKRQQEEEAP